VLERVPELELGPALERVLVLEPAQELVLGPAQVLVLEPGPVWHRRQQ
jgi:hypothetical protein